ncbi:hypothetical protein [Radiobacillus deserti]|uniref:Uncharacterized protein n=1 Tax=Radiobacillus deserti TaxID=2594883 RepID=A0A516KJB3_9BACI|nr:hypothetical protein [Radiobacillus deserti]QDP41490.1 hypothetical protein FN924_15695 [Radiobacillus deserti]
MITIFSILIYVILLFLLSTLLFFTLTSIWVTNEPIIVYLLCFIIIHLLLHAFGTMKKDSR